jgi:hypothetical protein
MQIYHKYQNWAAGPNNVLNYVKFCIQYTIYLQVLAYFRIAYY